MAKRTRKPSKSQRDKSNIAVAKYLKEQGLLSKQTKLHGGKFISSRVLTRVRELEWIAQNKYKAVPVKRDYVEKARAHGMLTAQRGSRNFAIVPPNPVEVKRVKRGIVSGVVPIPGGQIYSVALPYNNMSDFVRAVNSGEVDSFKTPKEEFAFTYFGNMSRRSFKSARDLREWLHRYDFVEWIGDADMSSEMTRSFAHFTLYRVMPGAWNPRDFTERREFKFGQRRARQMQQDRRVEGRRNRRVSEISAAKLEARRAADAERKREYRARLKEEAPNAYRAMLDKNKARAVKSKQRRKPE